MTTHARARQTRLRPSATANTRICNIGGGGGATMAAAGSESIHLGNGREDDGEERPELAELLAPAAVRYCSARYDALGARP